MSCPKCTGVGDQILDYWRSRAEFFAERLLAACKKLDDQKTAQEEKARTNDQHLDALTDLEERVRELWHLLRHGGSTTGAISNVADALTALDTLRETWR